MEDSREVGFTRIWEGDEEEEKNAIDIDAIRDLRESPALIRDRETELIRAESTY